MPTTGAMPGIKAFTAAVFGGIGSIPGAMIGGISSRYYRDICKSVYINGAFGRYSVRSAHNRTSCETDGSSRQENKRKGIRWCGNEKQIKKYEFI